MALLSAACGGSVDSIDASSRDASDANTTDTATDVPIHDAATDVLSDDAGWVLYAGDEAGIITDIAVDSLNVYWTMPYPTSRVMSCAINGCANNPTTLAKSDGRGIAIQ